MTDRTKTVLYLALAAAAVFALAFAPVHAAETADVVIISDDCRLIRKPAAKTVKKRSIVIQRRVAAPVAAASAPAPAASHPILRVKAKKKRSPLDIVNPQPDEYELNCDEAAPTKPTLLVEAEPEAPFTPVPEDLPPLALAPPEPFVPRQQDTPPETFVEGCDCGYGPPVIIVTGGPPGIIVVRGPPEQLPPGHTPAIPEPGTWALLAAGLYLVRRFT